MIQDTINNFILNYGFEDSNKHVKKADYQTSQHELMNAIHQEFQKSFVHKLYSNPKWTDKIFWNVAGTLQQKYYDKLSLDQIIEGIKRYLAEQKMIIPQLSQRDRVKVIRDIIYNLQQKHDGKAPIYKVFQCALENSLNQKTTDDTIRQLKREGLVFEPREGYYKCI